MSSISQVSRTLRRLFEEEAGPLARQEGLRERSIRFQELAYLLVLGWWHRPDAGPSALARFAGSLGLTLRRQDVDCHLTQATAQWLLALLRRGMQELVCATGVTVPLLQQFTAVLVEDASTISLPSALKEVWQGCGGNRRRQPEQGKTEAALKVTVRFDLLGGGLQGPHLQAGRQHELSSVLHEQQMPRGSLWVADLGYWSLPWLKQLQQQGVYLLLRYKVGIVLWKDRQRLDLEAILPTQEGERVEMLVEVGAAKALSGVRLVAERVPQQVAQQRQERYREYARVHRKPINPRVLHLAHGTLLITTVPAHLLSSEQAFALLRARWQIELLFKLWKQEALLEEWKSARPWHILCEVYAKLLAMLIQHWVMLLCCWDDPHRSLVGVAEVLREQVPVLVHGLMRRMPLQRAFALMLGSVRGGCCIDPRSTRLSTSRRLQSAAGPGLT